MVSFSINPVQFGVARFVNYSSGTFQDFRASLDLLSCHWDEFSLLTRLVPGLWVRYLMYPRRILWDRLPMEWAAIHLPDRLFPAESAGLRRVYFKQSSFISFV